METIKLCKRGHPKTLENVYKNGNCKLCKQAYDQSPKRKAYQKTYLQSSKYEAAQKSYLQKKIGNLSDSYVTSLLGLKVGQASAELIDMKRNSLFKNER